MAPEKTPNHDLYIPVESRHAVLPADHRFPPSKYFPPATATTPDGVLAIGGQLTTEWLLDAYSHGIFPWPFEAGQPIVWWSPDPRAILEFESLHVPRRLARTMRRGEFRVTCNQDFASVIIGCATASGRRQNTWLTEEMILAYQRMHSLGHAHSIEVWKEDELVGGTYGVAIGALFAAESMFHRVSDASKIAVVCLVRHLHARGYQLLDLQQWTPHTGRMGAIEISRTEYLYRLAKAVNQPVTFGTELEASDLSS